MLPCKGEATNEACSVLSVTLLKKKHTNLNENQNKGTVITQLPIIKDPYLMFAVSKISKDAKEVNEKVFVWQEPRFFLFFFIASYVLFIQSFYPSEIST